MKSFLSSVQARPSTGGGAARRVSGSCSRPVTSLRGTLSGRAVGCEVPPQLAALLPSPPATVLFGGLLRGPAGPRRACANVPAEARGPMLRRVLDDAQDELPGGGAGARGGPGR